MKLFAPNIADSYKVGHVHQYPADTEFVYSNFTPRSARLSRIPSTLYDGMIVVVGIQGAVKEYLDHWDETFFKHDKATVIKRYARRIRNLLGYDIDMSHLEYLHDLGYLPIDIVAIEEGSLVPVGTPLFVIYTNTTTDGTNKHEVPMGWLTGYVETALSSLVWKTLTAATSSFYMRELITLYQTATGSPAGFVPYQGHDFAMRGMSGPEDSSRTGFGHISSFIGTDNLLAIDYAEDYYGADSDKQHVGESVSATEHSVTSIGIELAIQQLTKYGQYDGFVLTEWLKEYNENAPFDDIRALAELISLKRLIKSHRGKILSYVADTYDFFRVLTDIMPFLVDDIKNMNGKFVVRPDSGDPVKILTGSAQLIKRTAMLQLKNDVVYKWYNSDTNTIEYFLADLEPVVPTPQQRGAVELLAELFGTEQTELGYRVLPPYIGTIYGDSINFDRADQILYNLKELNFGAIPVFGLGSFFFQYTTRDEYGMAMKATQSIVTYAPEQDPDNPVTVTLDVKKDPVTDNGTKVSLKGHIEVVQYDDGWISTHDQIDENWWKSDASKGKLLLTPLVSNGKLIRFTTLSEIRMRLHKWDDTKLIDQ